VHAGLDDHLLPALRLEASLDGGKNFRIGERKALDIGPVEKGEMDRLHF
jgi:hypothetical protein